MNSVSGSGLGGKYMDKDTAWGRDQIIAIAAVRYCLGRRTYIVSDCVDWVISQWGNFDENTKAVIRRDIDEAFQRDDEIRASGFKHTYRPLGWDCDRAQWEMVRQLWRENEHD